MPTEAKDGGVRVLVADRRPPNASGLAAMLDAASGYTTIARCHTPLEIDQTLPGSRVGMLLLDPGLYGDPLLALQAVRTHQPRAAILLTTTRIDESLMLALARPNVSCVSAFSQPEAILLAARALTAGETHLPSDVQRALTKRRLRQAPGAARLSDREHEILRLAARGLTIQALAQVLHITPNTAKTHLRRTYRKLGAHNRATAIAIAARHGLLDLNSPLMIPTDGPVEPKIVAARRLSVVRT